MFKWGIFPTSSFILGAGLIAKQTSVTFAADRFTKDEGVTILCGWVNTFILGMLIEAVSLHNGIAGNFEHSRHGWAYFFKFHE